jgi:hypothetical protein
MAKRPAKRSRSAGAVEVAMPSRPADSESIRIRAITNGWIINRSGTKRGKWFDDEEFTSVKPVLQAAPEKKGGGRGERR